jgi:transposase InsO family protein
VVNEAEYSDLPPSQIVPRLADKGQYIASESSFYRVLSQARQLHPRGLSKPRTPSPQPKGYCANAPCQVWSWDITYLRTVVADQFFYLYLILDIYSRKIVGWEVHEVERAEYAAELLKRTILAEGISDSAKAPVLHSDNGSPMKGATMIATMQALGVKPSLSRPSVSNDNSFSESLFRTLKGCPQWPDGPFQSLDQARDWVYGFVQWYNHEHRHSGIGFVTPVQRHDGEDKDILSQRKVVYEQAKKRRPDRWSSNTRNWNVPTDVWLNPPANIQ